MIEDREKDKYKNGEFFLCEDTATVFVKVPFGKLTCVTYTNARNGVELARAYLEKAKANNEHTGTNT